MPLNLFYITNRPAVARVAQQAGVDRIFLDMEYLGKEDRQGGMDTVQSHHTVEDVATIRAVLTDTKLLVRINPIHTSGSDCGNSREEIERVLDAGADVMMLPMYRTVTEVEEFLRLVNGRATTVLLTETPDACNIMDEVVKIGGVDEIHLGLNDLHLAYHKKFMCELLTDGTVDALCAKIKASGKPFGFGGIARIGYGMLPAELVIGEHYRIGSTRAILSRSFCNADKLQDIDAIQRLFAEEVVRIRETERQIAAYSEQEFNRNRERVKEKIRQIVKAM